MNYLRLASRARKVAKAKEELDQAQALLDVGLSELAKEAEKHGLKLWTKFHNNDAPTYYWENKHKQIANYPTLQEAILAYGSEQIDFE